MKALEVFILQVFSEQQHLLFIDFEIKNIVNE